MKKTTLCLTALLLALPWAGCSKEASPDPATTASSAPDIDATQFLLDEEPEGAREVIAVREDAKNDDPVVIVGRIGGSTNPWGEGRAAFSIVDNSLLACSDREGDDCPVPWDYCCETDKLPTSQALVKFVDENGRPLAADPRQLFSIKELQTVVIRGTAKRDDAGNLTVLADGMFVRN